MKSLALALLFIAPAAWAQTATTTVVRSPADEVRRTVEKLFDGMRAGDSTAVRATLHPEARFQSVVPGEGGGVRLVDGSADRFVEAVGTPHDAVWDEQIGDVEVRLDAGLAMAWMTYRFYLGERFSHCGVNSMQLVIDTAAPDRTWRIVNLIDTRRTDCD